jgi:hypothetical protein
MFSSKFMSNAGLWPRKGQKMYHHLYIININDKTVSIFVFIWRYLRCVNGPICFLLYFFKVTCSGLQAQTTCLGTTPFQLLAVTYFIYLYSLFSQYLSMRNLRTRRAVVTRVSTLDCLQIRLIDVLMRALHSHIMDTHTYLFHSQTPLIM